jgi:hypothetical protein
MKNTDFMNLSLPEGTDKIDIEILNSDFTAIENLLKQHAIIETMTLNGEGVIIGAIGPYIRLQNIDTVQVSIDIGKETYTLASGENVIIRETAENIGIITSGNAHITYFVSPKTYADKEFYNKKKVDELLSKVEGNVEVDAELSETSENPVQNKVITAKFKEYYNSKEVDELIDGIGTPEDIYTKTETDNLLSTKANKSNTYTKTETDNKITEKVSEIVAGAPEDFDTLKEMSDWLTEHEDSAASMNSAIQKNAEDIVTANTNITKNTTDIATANTAIQKNKTDIETANSVIQQNKTDISTANTNIQKNVDDIATVKNDVAINRTTLGTQCKNLFKLKQNAGYTQTVSGVSYTFNDDGSITASGTLTGEAALNFSEIYLEAGTYRISSSKFFNIQIYKSSSYVGGYQATPEGKVITISESGTYSFRWYWGVAGAIVNSSIYPMLTYADISGITFEPYVPNINTRISLLETLSDIVYKRNNSARCNIDGYALRVGNQLHLNLTATFHSACDAWWGGVLNFPFKVKTPDGSGRYTIKQTQSDGRETSVYISNGGSGIYTSTAFQKDDVITFPPMILDMYVEGEATTEGGE